MKQNPWRILLVDDDEDDYLLSRTLLAESRHAKFALQWASSYDSGLAALRSTFFDAVLVDYDMGARNGIELIREAIAGGLTVPMILLTGRGTYDVGLEAMQVGAADYLNKSEINGAFLERSIHYAIERQRSQRELAAANNALAEANRTLAETNVRLQASREELELKNQRLEILLQNAPAGIVMFDARPPYIVLSHNTVYQQYFPEPFYSQGMRGLPVEAFLPNAAESGMLDIFEETAATGKSRTLYSFSIDGMPGGRAWWNWNLTPLIMDGKVQALVKLSVNITRERQAQETAEQERAFLEAVLEQMPAAVVIAEAPSGRLILGNRQVQTIWRKTFPAVENLQGYSVFRAFHPDGNQYQPEDWPLARALFRGEVVRDQEVRILRGDNTYGTVLISATPIRTAEGKIIAASAIMLDVTERKRAEEDQLFLIDLGEVLNRTDDPEELLSMITELTARHLDVTRCIFADVNQSNNQACFHAGYHHQAPPFKNNVDLEKFDAQIIESLQSGRTVIVRDTYTDPRTASTYETMLAPRGLRAYIAVPLMRGGVWSAALILADNRPRNWNERQVAFLQVVAERAWAAYETHNLVCALRENELRAQHLAEEAQNNLSKLETIIMSMGEGVLLGDPSGSLVRINPAAVALHGYDREEEMKRSLGELYALFETQSAAGKLVPLEDWPFTRAIKGETVVNVELNVLRRDTGKTWTGLYSSIPIRNARGEVILSLTTITNITQIRLSEHQQRELDTRLQVQRLLVEQREQERLQIARDLHDGPIQELIGLMFILQTARKAASIQEVTQLLSGASQEAEKLVTNLRGVCNELRPPMLDKFGLAKAIQVHVDDLIFRHSPVEFRLDLDNDYHVLEDESRLALYRIFQESVNNILRHARASLVSVRLEIDADSVALTIEDNGQGFPMPSDWLSLAREGHLGLVGIKERAEAIGAALELTSAPGAGTRIQVKLQRVQHLARTG